jgi:RNA polymerase sigma-70 factor (ECF subfamily)
LNGQNAKLKEKKGRKGSSEALAGDQLTELVEKAQAGDVEAFHGLYTAYGQKILNYLYRMTGSKDDAEDLSQDTFVLAFRKLVSLRDPRRFQSWLFRIAQNSVYQKYRGRKYQIESIDEEDSVEVSDAQRLATAQLSPEEDVLSNELEELVKTAIAELPEKYRSVFVLSAVQKLSYLEISEIVDRSLASVKSDIHRARVAIRDRIKEYLGENYGMSKLH